MRGSLSVRINDGTTDRMVTSRTTGLRFRKTAPGGHHSASCTISVPRSTFPDLGPADRLYFYDARTGGTVWEGYTENPGATDGPSGQSYDLQASGGMILTKDRSEKAVYAEMDLGEWQTNVVNPSTSFETDSSGNINLAFQSGGLAGNLDRAEVIYKGLLGTRQTIGGFTYTWVGGKTDAAWYFGDGVGAMDSAGGGIAGTFAVQTSQTLTTTVGSVNLDANTFGGTSNYLVFRLIRGGGATNIADNQTTAQVANIRVRARLFKGDGTYNLPTAQTQATNIVADALGRLMLGQIDLGRTVLDTTSYVIDQLAFRDGATAGQIFDALASFEPDYYWGLGASNASGQHEFWYRAWPTAPRYEISVKDGYNAPGSDVDLCNRIAVNYTDATGVKRSTVVSTTVPELGSRVRDADSVSLPDGLGSAANAQQVGAMILAQKTADAPTAATAVVRRPIMDNVRGCMVMPWEIEPGYLVRVRETGEDLRLTEMEYTDADCAATLTLGTPVLSEEQILARVS